MARLRCRAERRTERSRRRHGAGRDGGESLAGAAARRQERPRRRSKSSAAARSIHAMAPRGNGLSLAEPHRPPPDTSVSRHQGIFRIGGRYIYISESPYTSAPIRARTISPCEAACSRRWPPPDTSGLYRAADSAPFGENAELALQHALHRVPSAPAIWPGVAPPHREAWQGPEGRRPHHDANGNGFFRRPPTFKSDDGHENYAHRLIRIRRGHPAPNDHRH